jgi:hypothetical protein
MRRSYAPLTPDDLLLFLATATRARRVRRPASVERVKSSRGPDPADGLRSAAYTARAQFWSA